MEKRKCKECGKEFYVDDSKRNWQHVSLCSQECQKSRINRLSREKYVKQKWPQELVCEWCNEKFLIHNAGQKANRKYCNRDCYLAKKRDEANRKIQSKLQTKICISCGKSFIPSKWTPERHIYCSKTCFRREMWDKHGAPKKRENYFYRVRRHVIKEFSRTCQICGSKISPQVHHLDGDRTNNLFGNLTVFCRSCHTAVHRITVVKISGEWQVTGKIFDIIGLSGNINIKTTK